MTAYITLPLHEYVALLQAARPSHPPDPRPGDEWAALAAIVGKVTARLNGEQLGQGDNDPDAEVTARIAVALLTQLIKITTPDQGTALLQDLGLIAATRGAR